MVEIGWVAKLEWWVFEDPWVRSGFERDLSHFGQIVNEGVESSFITGLKNSLSETR